MKRIVFASALVVGAALVFACQDDESFTPCASIPAGGCPLNHGVSCEDPACQAAYACFDQQWVLDHYCPGYEGGVPEASVPEASTDADASDIRDAVADAPPGAYGGPGCTSLQPPDCMLGTALSCPSGCCDCEDLYVCNNGGWDYYGSCTDGQIKKP